MISNPNLICYACIAQNETILGEIAKEPRIRAPAQNQSPSPSPHHSLYTHTVRKRTYVFSIADPFVFFGIFDQDLDQAEAIAFLTQLQSDFEKVGLYRDLESHCFQAEFDSIMSEVMVDDLDLPASRSVSMDDSSGGKGKRMVLTPLLGNHGLKKKKRLSGEVNGEMCKDVVMSSMEKKVEVCEDVRDFEMSALKSGGLHPCERQTAKQVWRKHVWVVLMLELCCHFVRLDCCLYNPDYI